MEENQTTNDSLANNPTDAVTTSPTQASAELTSSQSQSLDDLLADIEDMVGDDAQNFVQGFVQKGGE